VAVEEAQSPVTILKVKLERLPSEHVVEGMTKFPQDPLPPLTIVHSILASSSQAAPTTLKVGAGDLVGEVVRASVRIDGGRVFPAIKSRKSELEQGADLVKVPVIVANRVYRCLTVKSITMGRYMTKLSPG
jgi:hypothetical protein